MCKKADSLCLQNLKKYFFVQGISYCEFRLTANSIDKDEMAQYELPDTDLSVCKFNFIFGALLVIINFVMSC